MLNSFDFSADSACFRVIAEKKTKCPIVLNLLILSNLESWHSGTSSNKQNVNGQSFYGMFTIEEKSVNF